MRKISENIQLENARAKKRCCIDKVKNVLPNDIYNF